MSAIDQGEVTLTFNLRSGEKDTLTLKPTLQAAKMISNNFGGFANARQEIVRENMNAVLFVMRVGGKLNEQQMKAVEQKLFEHGMGDATLLGDVLDFVIMLSNGGKPKSLVDLDEGEVRGATSGNY